MICILWVSVSVLTACPHTGQAHRSCDCTSDMYIVGFCFCVRSGDLSTVCMWKSTKDECCSFARIGVKREVFTVLTLEESREVRVVFVDCC